MKSTFQSLLNPAHPLRSGLLFWGVFSLLAVLVRGVRWDENYEFAQTFLNTSAWPGS